MNDFRAVLYKPPEKGFPYLAVFILPSEKISTFKFSTQEEAEEFINDARKGYESDEPFDFI